LVSRRVILPFFIVVFGAIILGIFLLDLSHWRNYFNQIDTTRFSQTLLPGSQRLSPIDGMIQVYIPAGEFTLGESGGSNNPRHKVYLDAFWIDLTEVTNEMYARCVQEGKCDYTVRQAITELRYHDPAYANDPVVYVTWDSALEYCQWAGRRLPTEAEWEKAARGTDLRKYPWGNSPPDPSLLNYDNNVGETTAVGSYLEGASPYGVLDMAGNVREWVADWFNGSYYLLSPLKNPSGPNNGEKRVLRGGSYIDDAQKVQVTTRFSHIPSSAGMNRGFRCAVSSWLVSTPE